MVLELMSVLTLVDVVVPVVRDVEVSVLTVGMVETKVIV